MKSRFFNRIAVAIAAVFATFTGKGGLGGKPINLANAQTPASPVFSGGGNISIRRAHRTTNQRKRRKQFRALIANGSVR